MDPPNPLCNLIEEKPLQGFFKNGKRNDPRKLGSVYVRDRGLFHFKPITSEYYSLSANTFLTIEHD